VGALKSVERGENLEMKHQQTVEVGRARNTPQLDNERGRKYSHG
jgi:hypothetical protein